MSWSIKLGTIAGTQVRVHVTFALLLAWIWYMHYQIGGTTAAWQGVLLILAVFACVLLHEFGHALAARRYGIGTPDITLLPIGGLARLERMPEEPRQEFVIAIAGPLVNVVIAAVILVALGGAGALADMSRIEDPRTDFLVRLAGVNIFLVLFNLIPAFPMDGGRILRAALAARMSWSRATQIAATIGQGMAFLFGFVGLLYNPILIFIAIFVYLAAAAEAQDAQMRNMSSSLLAADAMVSRFDTLPLSASLGDAVEALIATSQHEFPVVDAEGRLEGIVMRDDLIRALREHGPDWPAVKAMRTDVPRIHHRRCLNDGLASMRESGTPVVAVLDGADRLVGLITHENIGEMMMVRAAAPESLLPRRGRTTACGSRSEGAG